MGRLVLRCIFQILLVFGGGAVLVTPSSQAATAQESIAQEYQIKAAFIFKFLSFVEWQSGPRDPAHICVLGENPFGSVVQQIIAVHDPEFQHAVVQSTDSLGELKSCTLVFVSKSEEGKLPDVLREVRGLPVITVSDIPGFARRGGMIELTLEGSNVQFIINQGRAKQEGIQFSSRLLALAKFIVLGS